MNNFIMYCQDFVQSIIYLYHIVIEMINLF